MRQASDAVGCSADELDTPVLCIDLDRLERNIQRYAQTCRQRGMQWRPHAKGHQSPEIARRQIEAGALGVTCAKMAEAEVMAAAGVSDILIANQLAGPHKMRRLAALRAICDPIVTVDHRDQVDAIEAAMKQTGQTVRAIIEVDIGLQRAGVPQVEQALELARYVARRSSIQFVGIMGYEGHLLTLPDQQEKSRRVTEALDLLQDCRRQIENVGLECTIVSAGGTGSYRFSIEHPAVTELQAGGWVFMDAFYRHVCQIDEFENALTVIATVVGRPARDRAIIDAGRKSINGDLHAPLVVGRPGVTVDRLSAEHGWLHLADEAQSLKIGDRVELIPGYGDFTCVLYDGYHVLRNRQVAAIWPISTRRRSL
jgi:D-serine deaminase-like pyridoxal phosphate-dependent protein